MLEQKAAGRAASARTAVGDPRAPRFGQRRVIAGEFVTPLFTSGTRFAGVMVEHFCASGVDALLQSTGHVVGVHVSGHASLFQSREGRSHAHVLARGDVTVTPLGAPKRWHCAEAREWIALRLDPGVVDHIAADCARGDAPPRLLDNFGTRDPAIEDIGRRLLHETQSPGLASDAHVNALTIELAVALLRRHSTASIRDERNRQRLPEHKLRRAREYVDCNLGESLTVSSIARAIAMSPCHFAHVFRQATGQAPHRFVVERRLERAKWLLARTETPIIDVAHEVGCRSQAHFAVLFRRETGMTPSAYRRARGRQD
jgi:AraC family transcriptional regulator